MKPETWLYVQPERLDGKLAMPVRGDVLRTAGMLSDLLACAAEPLGEPTWWCETRGLS